MVAGRYPRVIEMAHELLLLLFILKAFILRLIAIDSTAHNEWTVIVSKGGGGVKM